MKTASMYGNQRRHNNSTFIVWNIIILSKLVFSKHIYWLGIIFKKAKTRKDDTICISKIPIFKVYTQILKKTVSKYIKPWIVIVIGGKITNYVSFMCLFAYEHTFIFQLG